MKATALIVSATALTVLAISCAGSPTMPTSPPVVTPPPQAPSPAPSPQIGFVGTWTGMGADSQGETTVTWSLTQTGAAVSGTVATEAVSPNDGSCNSCHRNKSGSVSGTISGSTLTLSMFFAAGVNGDPTPACSQTLAATASSLADGTLAGEYTGADTCEGPFTNGKLAMARRE